MNVLLDTNILISIEPTSTSSIQQNSEEAAKLVRFASKGGIQLFIHPSQLNDIENDRDEDRKKLRKILLNKYQLLEPAPAIHPALATIIGESPEGTNHHVDDQLLAALFANAVTYLVTEDKQIHRKAARAGIGESVLSLSDAIHLFSALFDVSVNPPPAVQHVKAYQLDREDRIWQSFTHDYPGFDEWLTKCARQQRDAWIITSDSGYAAVTIVNQERNPPAGLSGKVLKICSFKSDESHSGSRYGELLLKAILRYGEKNNYDWYFIESYSKQEALLYFLSLFGFQKVSEKNTGEIILAKPGHPRVVSENLHGLEYHIRFGPRHIDWSRPAFIVPIQPRFESILFPDQQSQLALMEGEHAFGNAIRKAYLCHSPIKKITPGSILMFYRSASNQGITTVGVVENVLRSSDPEELARFVLRRTVYSMDQIRDMAQRPVLAIQFRHANHIEPHIRLHEMTEGGILSKAPQSIVSVPEGKKPWIMTRVGQ